MRRASLCSVLFFTFLSDSICFSLSGREALKFVRQKDKIDRSTRADIDRILIINPEMRFSIPQRLFFHNNFYSYRESEKKRREKYYEMRNTHSLYLGTLDRNIPVGLKQRYVVFLFLIKSLRIYKILYIYIDTQVCMVRIVYQTSICICYLYIYILQSIQYCHYT